MKRIRSEKGFTLLELLVTIAIISVLAYLGLTAFWVYRSTAAYSVATTVMRDTRVAIEASLNDLDHPPSAVALTSQNVLGPIQNAAARTYLPGMQIPRSIKLSVAYDPTCTTGACQSDYVEVKHCAGTEYIRWIRFGDGVEADLGHINGSGCS